MGCLLEIDASHLREVLIRKRVYYTPSHRSMRMYETHLIVYLRINEIMAMPMMGECATLNLAQSH